MAARIVLHSAAMIVINVLALRIGLAWDGWVHQRHPFASLIPAGALFAVAGFAFWYFAINALDANRRQLADFQNWKALYVIVLILCPILFFAVPSQYEYSKGRFVTVTIFNLLVNGLTVAMVYPLRSADAAGALRGLIARSWVRRGLALAGVLAVTCVVIASVEGVCYLANRPTKTDGPKKVREGGYPAKFNRWDDVLGTALIPNADVDCRFLVNDKTIWDVRYTSDTAGRRTTIVPDMSKATEYAVFFGCSFLFGEGSNDNETIPSQFALAAPQYRAYNYGVPGYGTQQMLAKLETDTIASEIEEERGVVIYLYLEDVHEPRVIGGMQVTTGFAWNYPYYNFDDEGRIRRYGTFTSGRPVLSKVYWLLSKSHFVRTLGLNFPRPSDEHYHRTAAIIAASKKHCEQQLGCERFLVAVYPKPSAHKKLLAELQQTNVEVLDYSDLFDPNAEGMFHPGDGHPTPKANQIFAQQLATDVAALVADSSTQTTGETTP